MSKQYSIQIACLATGPYNSARPISITVKYWCQCQSKYWWCASPRTGAVFNYNGCARCSPNTVVLALAQILVAWLSVNKVCVSASTGTDAIASPNYGGSTSPSTAGAVFNSNGCSSFSPNTS